MTEPTEAEIEAAALTIGKTLHWLSRRLFGEKRTPCPICKDLARAALTAAAQVRERAEARMPAPLPLSTSTDRTGRTRALQNPLTFEPEPDYGEDFLGERPKK